MLFVPRKSVFNSIPCLGLAWVGRGERKMLALRELAQRITCAEKKGANMSPERNYSQVYKDLLNEIATLATEINSEPIDESTAKVATDD
jgi:hypothetical protein